MSTRLQSLSEPAAQHLSRCKDLGCSSPASTDTLFLGLPQSSRALPLLLPSTPFAPSFCLSCPQAAIIQHSPGVDADIRAEMTTLKGHFDHSSTAFKPLTSIRSPFLRLLHNILPRTKISELLCQRIHLITPNNT